jgi:hypothetical protein
METALKVTRFALRGVVLVSMVSLLTGCIVIPSGHRHHRGYATVVVPIQADRHHDDRRGGHERRGYRDDAGPRRY